MRVDLWTCVCVCVLVFDWFWTWSLQHLWFVCVCMPLCVCVCVCVCVPVSFLISPLQDLQTRVFDMTFVILTADPMISVSTKPKCVDRDWDHLECAEAGKCPFGDTVCFCVFAFCQFEYHVSCHN